MLTLNEIINNRCDIQGLLPNYRIQHNVKKTYWKMSTNNWNRKKTERIAAAVCGICRAIFHFIFAVWRIMDDDEDDLNHSHSTEPKPAADQQDYEVTKSYKTNKCFSLKLENNFRYW